MHSCDLLSNSSDSRPPRLSRSKTEIEGGDKPKVKHGADLFNGHQTGIGQFGENQCKFIHQVEERDAHCITLLPSLHCAVQILMQYVVVKERDPTEVIPKYLRLLELFVPDPNNSPTTVTSEITAPIMLSSSYDPTLH